jgi:hypothetical protein
MVRYYACSHCDWRWQVGRGPVDHHAAEVECADSVLPVFSC